MIPKKKKHVYQKTGQDELCQTTGDQFFEKPDGAYVLRAPLFEVSKTRDGSRMSKGSRKDASVLVGFIHLDKQDQRVTALQFARLAEQVSLLRRHCALDCMGIWQGSFRLEEGWAPFLCATRP